MKRNLLTLAAVSAIVLGGFAVVQAQPGHGGGGRWQGHGFGLEHLTKELNLTADQQTKVQPIIMDSTTSQIRPLLTTDQQKKLDDIQKAHQDMMNAHKELHDAMQE